MTKNPTVLLLTSRDFDYDDCEFEVSNISYYYIIPAGKLKEQQIEFKNEVADDELLLIIFFKDALHAIRMQIKTNIDENQRLVTLRDALLPRLMSGELDVSNINF